MTFLKSIPRQITDSHGRTILNPFLGQGTGRTRLLVTLLSLLLLLPNLMALFLAADLTSVWMRVVYAVGSLLLFVLPAAVFPARTFFLVQSPLLFFGIIEMVHLIVERATTSMLFVYTMMIAEFGETYELLSNYAIPIVLLLMLWGVYFWLVIKHVPNQFLVPRKWRLTTCLGIPALFLLGLVVLWLNPLPRMGFPINNEDTRQNALAAVKKICPLDLYTAVYDISVLKHEVRQGQQAQGDFSFGVRADSVPDDEVVVLVIGETARYDHFGLNGYERNTTPRLGQRANLVSYDSVYSIANLTTVSVPMMLSRATPQDTAPFIHERSVVDAFHEAGFRTSWIANQSFGNKLIMRTSEACDYCHYLPAGDETNNRDLNLLPLLREQLHAGGRQLIVVHSLGCHFQYNKRYPAEFSVYKPDNGQDMMKRELLVNSYDNATLYTDCFLDSVITLLELTGRPAAMLYVADHGENLMDDERRMFLHGTYHGSVYEYHVPFFVWTSEPYRLRYPAESQSVSDNRHKKVSAMVLFHSLLQLGGISYDRLDSTMSIASPQLAPQPVLYRFDANLNCTPLPSR